MAKKEESGPAVEKRTKIKKTKQQMMIIVLVGALSVGVSFVLAIHFVKYMTFYDKVIDKKEQSVKAYEKTIQNVGLCKKPKGSSYTLEEIQKCNPNTYNPGSGTLRYNITNEMAYNEDLESVARESTANICYDEAGNKKDYQALADAVDEADESTRSHYLGLLKICSSLRVIPDALPAGKNVEALLASLNKIFTVSGLEPEGLSPGDNIGETDIEGVDLIPTSMSIDKQNASTIINFLTNAERSIRNFELSSATVEWSGSGLLDFDAQVKAYYAKDAGVAESDTTEYATKQARKKASS